MTDVKDSKLGVSNSVDNEFRWQTVLTQVKHSHKIVKMIEKNESLTFKFEQILIDFLKSLSPEDQQILEEHSLTSVNVRPSTLDVKAFETLKEELLMEERPIEEQYRYCTKMEKSDKKIAWLIKIAKTGHREAQFDLGYIYHYSDAHFADSYYWYTKASEQGCEAATNNLAALLEKSTDQNDKKKAFELMKQVSQNNSSVGLVALVTLGSYYKNGFGVEIDLKQAIACFLKAAEKNNATAQYQLGYCYEYGIGVEKSPETSFQWYTKSANNGFVVGQFELAHCYQYGFGTLASPQKAFEWFSKAANNGDAQAQNNIGTYCRLGYGVAMDKKKAIEWYISSANNGNPKAYCNLAECYKAGEGVEKNDKKAFEWYTQAAENGYAPAQYSLGVCYFTGRGIEKDKTKAIEWYSRSAKLGNDLARRALAECQ